MFKFYTIFKKNTKISREQIITLHTLFRTEKYYKSITVCAALLYSNLYTSQKFF